MNSKGKFNVPFGRYKNPKIFDENVILQANQLLKGVKLKCESFEKIEKYAEKGDFVYFDPPYFPISKTAYFTSYTKDLFLEKEQKKLAETYSVLNHKACLLMLSNSDSDFIRNLYDGKGYKIEIVKAKHAISCNANTRGKISELLVLNY